LIDVDLCGADFLNEAMAEEEIIADLMPMGILSYITPEDLETLKYYGIFGEYGAGELIVRAGEDQKNLYVIVSGLLEVFICSGGTEVKLGEIAAGDCIGEVAVFDPDVASASVRVLQTAVLWSLDIEALQGFFEQLPVAGGQLLLGIAQLLSRRLRHANHVVVESRLLPKHLSVRCSEMPETIKACNLKQDKAKGLGGLFGKKVPGKFVPKIRK